MTNSSPYPVQEARLIKHLGFSTGQLRYPSNIDVVMICCCLQRHLVQDIDAACCSTEHPIDGMQDVQHIPPPQSNLMESFWLAETLKYLWLIFSPESVLPFDKYVLNTEAHPLLLKHGFAVS